MNAQLEAAVKAVADAERAYNAALDSLSAISLTLKIQSTGQPNFGNALAPSGPTV